MPIESEAIKEIRNLYAISNLPVMQNTTIIDGVDSKQLLKQTARRLIYFCWSAERSEVLQIMNRWK